jgi:ubiquinone/menaquinone biosynthesis C-methylase UbiE
MPRKSVSTIGNIKRETRDKYNDLGQKIYDIRYEEEQNQKFKIVLNELKLRKEQVVLDHGCGTGLFMKIIKTPIVGIDNSNQLLKGALKRTINKKKKYLVQGDIEYLPFRRKTFHKLFSFTVMQNIEDPLCMLKEIKRVTVGLKVITTLKKAYNKTKLIELIEKSGMNVIKIIDTKDINDWILFVR